MEGSWHRFWCAFEAFERKVLKLLFFDKTEENHFQQTSTGNLRSIHSLFCVNAVGKQNELFTRPPSDFIHLRHSNTGVYFGYFPPGTAARCSIRTDIVFDKLNRPGEFE